MPTNKELTQQVKELKAEIRELKSQVKETENEVQDLPLDAYGVVINDGVYYIANVKFDPETKNAVVGDVNKAGTGTSYIEAASYVKKGVVDALVKLKKDYIKPDNKKETKSE